MRKATPADVLFTPTKQSILSATYGQPERWWYLSELAIHAGKSPSSLQRDLRSLTASGLLRTRKDRSRVYFQAETDSPLFIPLQQLVEQTMGVVENLKQAFEAIADRIQAAFIYGSVSRGEETAKSDVDILVIGSLGQAELGKILRPLETRYGRELNAKVYSPDEFETKRRAGNHFIIEVLKERKIFIVGNEYELERSNS